ncbi:response regulator [Amycolatopsis magusensis]|uniref:DNA-binding response OmpR family regulator n=1 Tax=Amycolatopsis magusensis TaxID=882444 RepID=A0ABS4PJ43_9PSEU|nr:response regulator transcription factor [Amycolatopsis magusensis]MBP2179383.1 DNA-binding response OmpR family regulator [Amycolatopsis magusensis]MDI5977342.1 response regulator transcription factor [Amycolatopsis magusensis]
MAMVLLVEDDRAVREGLGLALRRQGHVVHAAESGEHGLDRLREHRPDIVVLDLMLPGIDGFETCRRIRADGDTPIIMLTARSHDFDVVAGLEAGADDYVVKPVEPRVLDARIRAVLRRAVSEQQSDTEQYGELVIDRTGLVVTLRGEPVPLTPTELKLLLELSRTPGRVLSRQQILEAVWEHDYLGDSRLVDACVQRLRAKIERVPASPRHVETVRGFGYRFARP